MCVCAHHRHCVVATVAQHVRQVAWTSCCACVPKRLHTNLVNTSVCNVHAFVSNDANFCVMHTRTHTHTQTLHTCMRAHCNESISLRCILTSISMRGRPRALPKPGVACQSWSSCRPQGLRSLLWVKGCEGFAAEGRLRCSTL